MSPGFADESRGDVVMTLALGLVGGLLATPLFCLMAFCAMCAASSKLAS